MRRWDGLVEKYVRECEARGLAQSTIAMRWRELERAGAWLKRRRPRPGLADVDGDLIVGYIRSRTKFRSRALVCNVVTHLRGMGEFLVREGIWCTSPLRWMKGPKVDARAQVPRRLSRGQQEKIWAEATRRRGEFARHQAVCALAILYATGLRRDELERLELGDWDRKAGILEIDGRKSGKARRVPVGEGAWRCIEAYLPHRHNLLEKRDKVGESALLVGRNGKRLKGRSIWGMVRRLAQRAGAGSVTLHQYRHSCASDLLESGATIAEVQRVLGHAGIQSTMRYVQLTDPQRRAAVEKHPVNEMVLATEGRSS